MFEKEEYSKFSLHAIKNDIVISCRLRFLIFLSPGLSKEFQAMQANQVGLENLIDSHISLPMLHHFI